jgi:type II secretion system protein I
VIRHCRLSNVGCRLGKKESTRRPANHQSSIINHQSSKGFTLLEVLVALAIVGLAVTAILELFSSNLRAVSVSEDHVKASLRAEARMREILDSDDLAEKTWTETTVDGYRVDVAVSKVQTERTQTIGMVLFQVDLSLSWKRGMKNRTINLKTLKLVRPGDETKGVMPS